MLIYLTMIEAEEDRHRFLSLYRRYKKLMLYIAHDILHDPHDAEDAVQAVFCRLLEKELTIWPGRERAFLTKLTINHCKNQLAAAKRFAPEALDELRLPAEPEDCAVLRAVMELPEKYRLVVVLHCLEGYSFSEIAGLLQLTPSAVSMRLHRARKMLREQLGRDQ